MNFKTSLDTAELVELAFNGSHQAAGQGASKSAKSIVHGVARQIRYSCTGKPSSL